jgi:ParB-like chromosome segregation protein Spo0J
MMRLKIEQIRVDEAVQARAGINRTIVAMYAAALRAGAKFPPVTVFHDGTTYWLADGFHRMAAFVQNKADEIEVEIRPGTRRDAILHSCAANTAHGLRRTNKDKRQAVALLLSDPEFRAWSDREIAQQCGVGNRLVAALRRKLSVSGTPLPATPESLAGSLPFACPDCRTRFDLIVWHCRCGAHHPRMITRCPDCDTPRPEIILDYRVIRVGETLYFGLFAGLLPDLKGKAFEAFKASVREHGIRVRILLDEHNNVLDGWQRLLAAAALGLTQVPIEVRAGLSFHEKLKLFVIRNLVRANHDSWASANASATYEHLKEKYRGRQAS